MSIRNLGDWSVLDQDRDPVYADPDMVRAAQQRYQHISTTIDDAVTRLRKIVDANSDGLAGQYVSKLKDAAGSIVDRLSKAGVRYRDVADQIGKYEPDLDQGLTETAAALNDARAAQTAKAKASGMPDPQKAPDGTISADEQQKGTAKSNATEQANSDLDAAKKRLNATLDALNAAGKRFGDAVNGNNHNDGLTDTFWDKLDAFFAKISKALTIIGLVLSVLAIIIPGLNVLLLASFVVSLVTLVHDVVLYAHGDGNLLDVVLGAVGLALGGFDAVASVFAKDFASGAKTLAKLAERAHLHPPKLEFTDEAHMGKGLDHTPTGPPVAGEKPPMVIATQKMEFFAAKNEATEWGHVSDWFNNPATNWLLKKGGLATPDIGFMKSAGMQLKDAGEMWGGLFRDPWKSAKDFVGVVGGLSGYRELKGIANVVGGKVSPGWQVWGGINAAWGIGAGVVYPSVQLGQG